VEQINPNNTEKIITALKNGAVLVCPTDTVYGLVCDAKNEKAVEKIFEIKKRDKSKSLAVFVKDIDMAKKYAEISLDQEKKLQKFWPGATTFILPAKPGLSPLAYKNNTIGMRASDYDLIKNIFKEFNSPLAQTSANISGQPATGKIKEVLSQLSDQGTQPDIVVDVGDLPENKPSTIIDLTKNNKALR